MPGLSLDLTNYVAENVIYYCTRFRESVFVQDIATEERFGNLNQDWIDLNPNGKAIIAIPIEDVKSHMQGVLYVEGDPSSFTDRNFTVLALLVNQMSISYSNAQYMKALEKASAQTISAAGVQKRALGEARAAEQKARDAESKAKRAEEEAVRNVKLAEEAARAKSSFLANVSHELRTPLNGVIGNADLLSRGDLDAEQQEIAESIRVSADLLLVVINDLLDFSRIEAEKMQLHIQEFTPYVLLSEIIRAARFTYKDRYRNNQVEIIEDIQLPRSLNVMGDPIRLHQVLAEDNAINRRIAVQFLRRLGYVHIDTYENGQLAIDGLQRMASNQTPYHLVLMDVQMPVLDGYSATKKIRLDPVPEIRDVLIIAMTASAIHGDREKCLEAGMNDYLAKPVKSEVLKNKIDAYFRVSDSRVPKWLPTRAVKS
ncbi:Hybrid signal transduction histidine kinase J [Ceratocystis platani]|uniref:histidine kinase n=1 Tax=Ceratocystis fimbriata f. sp. platani TaxID=88771 RepID=A0A0F8D1Q8_CERFI|nr:Hybrid signal transduction histidine kinase J [Ceratocystis platani]